MQENSTEFYVEKILSKRILKGRPQYLIKWLGWPESQATWEPRTNLQNVLKWVDEFEKTHNNLSEDASENNNKKVSYNKPDSAHVFLEAEDELTFKADESDIPLRIITANIVDNILCFLVEWEIRPDGISPDSSYVKNNFLKDNYPKILIEFYESKIKFINKKNK